MSGVYGIFYCLFVSFVASTSTFAKNPVTRSAKTPTKNLGSYGTVFEIQEEPLDEYLQNKLQGLGQEKIDKIQASLKQKMLRNIEAPTAVSGITKTITPRTFTFDPSITLTQDIRNHQGEIIHKKGLRFNPLHYQKMQKTLIFIDGDDEAQVKWAVKQSTPHNTKIILVKGRPFDVMKTHDVVVFFDQSGTLTQKFKIKHVPARVFQTGDVLTVSEEQLP